MGVDPSLAWPLITGLSSMMLILYSGVVFFRERRVSHSLIGVSLIFAAGFIEVSFSTNQLQESRYLNILSGILLITGLTIVIAGRRSFFSKIAKS